MKLDRVLSATMAISAALLLCGSAGAAVWHVPGDFPTIQAAISSSAVVDGDVLRVSPGRRAGATVTKALDIRARGRVTIVSGPFVNTLGNAGFLFPGDGAGSGATIDGFRFEGVAFPVFSRGADDVSITHNTMLKPNQGVTSWANGGWGRGWDIAHNAILDLRTDCGGGIGILIGDYAGGTVSGNLIAHNEVRGRVRVPSSDCGGYGAPGVVLFADWRYPGDKGATITRNRVVKNRVFLSSTNPELVPVSGVQLADTSGAATEITGNEVVYNDLRGTSVPVDLSPPGLGDPVNRIEKNLTGAVGHGPDRALDGLRLLRLEGPEGPEAAPVR